MPIAVISADEKSYYEWFFKRTVVKLPGAFSIPFWGSLLIQASASEPAILHAVLLLSSAHKGEKFEREEKNNLAILDPQEHFLLSQYSKAIRYLQPRPSVADGSQIRVTLIACLLFLYAEIFRHNYQSALIHLHNGVRLLEGIHPRRLGLPASSCVEILYKSTSTDDHILQAFARLQLQARLFNQGPRTYFLLPRLSELDHPGCIFRSPGAARERLDVIFSEILKLMEDQQLVYTKVMNDAPIVIFLDRQKHIQAELLLWLKALKASCRHSTKNENIEEVIAYSILEFFHYMAYIMADTCLSSHKQVVFDAHTGTFLSLLAHAIITREKLEKTNHMSSPEHSLSVADAGWIPPLYYTATKCRVHRIRLQAIHLLGSVRHKEGIWDAEIAARIGSKVMELEEGDFLANYDGLDDYALDSLPSDRDLSLPVLPESRRLHDIQVALPEGVDGTLTMACHRMLDDGGVENLTTVYDPVRMKWLDSWSCY
jgi:hypothetical protein